MESLGTSPTPGLLEFTLPLAPVSLQAKGEGNATFKTAVQSFAQTAQCVLAGDIHLCVEWFVSERARYETDRSPDEWLG